MKGSRWLKISLYSLASVAILLAIVISSLSLIARHFTLNFLESRNLETLDLNQINIRLLAGNFSLKHLVANKNQQRGIGIEQFDTSFYWRPLWDNTLHIKHVKSDGTTIKIQQTTDGNYKVGLEPETAEAVEDISEDSTTPSNTLWSVLIDEIELKNIRIQLNNADKSAQLDVGFDLAIKALTATTAGNATIKEIAIKNFHTKANQSPAIAWQEFKVNDLTFNEEHLTLANLSVQTLELILKQNNIAADSTLAIFQAFTDPSISLAQIDQSTPEATTPETSKAEEADSDMPTSPEAEVKTSSTQLEIKLSAQLNDTAVQMAGDAKFNSLNIQDASFTIQNNTMVAWKNLLLNQFNYSKEALNLEGITFKGFTSILHRNKDGEIAEINSLNAFAEPFKEHETEESQASERDNESDSASAIEPQTDTDGPTKESGTQWRLGGLAFEENSSFTFHDASINPKFHKKLNIQTLQIGTIDSQKPEVSTTFTVKLDSETHENISLVGNMSFLEEKPSGEIDINIDHLDMTNLSGYAVDAIGHDISSGLFDLKTKANIKQGYLDSNSTLAFNKFRVSVADAEKAEEVNNFIQLPLNTALGVIRDKDDIIRLDIPVTGELTDPDFEIKKVVRKALAKSLRSASIVYLQYAIQPWGAALFVGKHLTGAATAVRFDPIVFKAGEAEVNNDMKKYLKKVSEFLNKKEGLSITACPITTLQDKEILQEQATDKAEVLLKDLGKQRLKAVKALLTDEFGVAPGQIVNCLAKYEASAAPQVELQL